MIYTAQIIDGELFKSNNPINVSGGKSPVIDSSNGLVSIVWADDDNSIKITTNND